MKKFTKGAILIPMWPLIWYKLGFALNKECDVGWCAMCSDCCERAIKMVQWWRGDPSWHTVSLIDMCTAKVRKSN